MLKPLFFPLFLLQKAKLHAALQEKNRLNLELINRQLKASKYDQVSFSSSCLQTDVWEKLCTIKDEYLKMLRACISISRAYYSAEMKALREDQKIKAKGW